MPNYSQYAIITLRLDYHFNILFNTLFGLKQRLNYQRNILWMFESIKNIKKIIRSFWSSGPNSNNSNNSWNVNFNNGNDNNNNRNNDKAVRLVRGGE